jgi:hypothetical protein
VLHRDHHHPEHQRCRCPDVDVPETAAVRRRLPERRDGAQSEQEPRREQHAEDHGGGVPQEEARLDLDHFEEGTQR